MTDPKRRDLWRRAAQPTLETIDRMRSQASEPLRSVLAETRDNVFRPGHTAAKVLRAVGVSRWIAARFRAEFHKTLGRFIFECRMETASRLLRDTSIAVEEIAYLVGYGSLSAFQRAFDRWCALSPSDYRACAQRVRAELKQLPEEFVTWIHWRRCRRSELSAGEARAMIRHLERLYGLG